MSAAEVMAGQDEAGVALGASTDSPYELPLSGLDKAFARFLQEAQSATDERHGMLAALTSYQFGRGHACLDLALLDHLGCAYLGWDARAKALLPQNLSAAAASLPWIAGARSPLVLDGSRLYLRRNWGAEQSIRASVAARLDQPCAVADDLGASLDLLFPAEVPSAEDSSPPDWQKVACALAARQSLTLITGGPGTGKTTTVVRLLALLQSAAIKKGKPLRVALAAPTGKAAARLGEAIASALSKLPPSMQWNLTDKPQTLHKLLRIRPDQPGDAAPELALDLVVVDEASMIDLEMMARLLWAVPVSAKLILLGDKDQLASVEAGAVMGQLCEGADLGQYSAQIIAWVRQTTGADLSDWAGNGSALAQQTVMLRHSRRFSGDSGIGLWAAAVNAGDWATVQGLWHSAPHFSVSASVSVDRLQPESAHDQRLTTLLQTGWQPWLQQLRSLSQAACTDEQAAELLKLFAGFQVLCAVREGPWGTVALNARIASSLGFAGEGWYAGRAVMVTRNDYNLKLMNGDVGLCLPHAKGLRVAFANGQGGVHWVLPSRLDAMESVFAMTVHKSQGSEFDHVCLVLPDVAVAVLTRELLYTGITRAKTRLTLVAAQQSVLSRAVQTRVLRSGGLAQAVAG
ncbi:MAG: exodeoxyribonuclease V subunit alpha [Betaproteobacteria bacterium]